MYLYKKKSEDLARARARARARTGPPPGGRGPNAPLEKVDRVSSGEFRGAFEILSAVSSFILSNFKVVRRNFFQ